MRRIALATALLGLALMLLPDPAAAATPYGTGLRQAKRRHVAHPQCYAQVFERYATLNRRGRWAWPSGGRRSAGVKLAYRHDLFRQCGISI